MPLDPILSTLSSTQTTVQTHEQNKFFADFRPNSHVKPPASPGFYLTHYKQKSSFVSQFGILVPLNQLK